MEGTTMAVTDSHPDTSTQQRNNNHGHQLPQKGLSRTFMALQSSRNFRLFWSGQLISLIGTWMQTTGQSWLVLQLTHSAWLLGVVGALQFVPVLLFSLFTGVIADRFPKRKLLLLTQTAAMILATILGLLVITGTVQLWHIFVLAVLLGLTNSLDTPVRQAFVVEMVGRETLPNAIALNSSAFNIARILGPGIAGLLIAWLGEAPLFLLNAFSFLFVLAGLLLMRERELQWHPQQDSTKQKTLKSLGEGLNYIVKMPAVFLIIATIGVISLFGINFNVVLPLFADQVLHAGPQGFGFLSSAFGIGALLAAIWLAWRNKKPTIAQMLIGGFLFGVLELFFSLAPIYVLSLLFIAAVGFAQISFTATANAALQSVTPNRLRGRVMSVYSIVFLGSNPVGNLLMGGIAHILGAVIALVIGAVPCILMGIVGWFLRRPAEKSLKEYVSVED
jgi:MFS family permease